MAKKFDTLLFDVGGVLIHQTATTPIIRDHLGMDDVSFESVWRPAIEALGLGIINEHVFWQQFADKGARSAHIDNGLLTQTLRDTLQIYHSLLDDIAELGRRGYRLAVLSDTIAPHAAVLRESDVYDIFGDNVFLSHEIGIRKPDPTAYRHILAQLKIDDPSTVLFMDDRERNLLPAQKLGMHTLLAPGTEAENRAVLLSAIRANERPADIDK